MAWAMDNFVIDVFEFCRQKLQREGNFAVADLHRLSGECADHTGNLQWSLSGEINSMGHAQCRLSVSGVVRLMCQRCLTPFAFTIASHSLIVLANDDEQADDIEGLLDDDTIDVIVGSKKFNFFDLIEDEALLALPLAHKHEVCPDSSVMDKVTDSKTSVFSVLKDLKQ